MYCILIDHPHEGLILWETGCGKDYPEVWGPALSDVFARIRYEPQHELPAAIEAAGFDIADIKKIVIGHLHLDHAGGLDQFFDRKDVEIWVHDKELRSALWSVATGADEGVYLEHYLKLGLYVPAFSSKLHPYEIANRESGIGRRSTSRHSTSVKESLCIIFLAIQMGLWGCRST